MQEGKFGRNRRYRRKWRLSYSCPSPCAFNSLFQTIKSLLWHLVCFLCASQVKSNILKLPCLKLFCEIGFGIIPCVVAILAVQIEV